MYLLYNLVCLLEIGEEASKPLVAKVVYGALGKKLNN